MNNATLQGWVHGRLGAYLNTMVADLKIEGKGQYLRDLFGKFEQEFASVLTASEYERGRRDGIEQSAQTADKMKQAAGEVLQKGHDDDAAVQYDTASEIVEAIRALAATAEAIV